MCPSPPLLLPAAVWGLRSQPPTLGTVTFTAVSLHPVWIGARVGTPPLTSFVTCGKCVNISERVLIHSRGVSDTKMMVLRMKEEDTCRKSCYESPPCGRRAEGDGDFRKRYLPAPIATSLTGRFAGLTVLTHVSVSSWSRRFKPSFGFSWVRWEEGVRGQPRPLPWDRSAAFPVNSGKEGRLRFRKCTLS